MQVVNGFVGVPEETPSPKQSNQRNPRNFSPIFFCVAFSKSYLRPKSETGKRSFRQGGRRMNSW